MEKRLYKSIENKMLDGVCGGIAEYFNIDPTLIRLAWVVFCALGGSGIIAYIIAAIIIPTACNNTYCGLSYSCFYGLFNKYILFKEQR